jgi:hypothetical protein
MLSLAQKAARVKSAIELKKVLCSAKRYGWRYILTSDESWFYFTINPDHAWVPERAVAPTRSRQIISGPKRILTVFRSPLGFSLVQILPKEHRFNVEYFCNHILHEIGPTVQVTLTKMLDEKSSSISTMPPLTLRL